MQSEGRAHEDAMHRRFADEFGPLYVPAPWLRYRNFSDWRYCQPDGLLFRTDGRVIICEAKLQHTPTAISQTERYKRVVSALLPRWNVCVLEVVRFYKGAGVDGFDIPVRVVIRPDGARGDIFNVLILPRW